MIVRYTYLRNAVGKILGILGNIISKKGPLPVTSFILVPFSVHSLGDDMMKFRFNLNKIQKKVSL